MQDPATAKAHKRVQVCVRVRPIAEATPSITLSGGVVVNAQEQTLSVVTNAAAGTGTCFHFDQVLPSQVTQAGLYSAAALELVESVLNGYNGTILAYGQTGAGKTFTMAGGRRSFDDRGVCARSISTIFQTIQRDPTHAYCVRVSYLEIYNEHLVDLLRNADESEESRAALAIQENQQGQTFVRGLRRVIVTSEEDALDRLFQGETNRTIAEHALNASSTRSHCIFTLYVEKTPRMDEESGQQGSNGGDENATAGAESSATVTSKLHLVDLAGSERMDKTHVSGVMLKEATHINKSLTFLEQVVIALGDRKRQHIPYRQTPLTNLLKDSLGGNCRTMLIACVWPSPAHSDQTLATLRFATRMMRVKTSAIVNIVGSNTGGNSAAVEAELKAVRQQYTNEIKRLKEELAMHDVFASRTCVEYDKKQFESVAAKKKMRLQVETYLRDPTEVPALTSLTQMQHLLAAFRDVCLEAMEPRASSAPPVLTSDDTSMFAPPQPSRLIRQFRSLRECSPRDTHSFSLPRLQSQAPMTLPSINSNQECVSESSETTTKLPLINGATSILPVDDKGLFELFKKQDSGPPESLKDLEVAKQNLRDAKGQASTLALDINRLKLYVCIMWSV